MKISWKMGAVFGSVLVFSVLGTVAYLHHTVSAADGQILEVALTETPDTETPEQETGVNETETATGGQEMEPEEPYLQSTENEAEKVPEQSAGDEVEEISMQTAGDEDEETIRIKNEQKLRSKVEKLARSYVGTPYLYEDFNIAVEEEEGMNTSSTGTYAGSHHAESHAGSHHAETYSYSYTEDHGVDDAGLIRKVFDGVSISMPKTRAEQAEFGEDVDLKDCLPGDIVFYGVEDDKITHCGICVWGDQVVHASSSKGEVIISDMNYRRIVKVKRVVGVDLNRNEN